MPRYTTPESFQRQVLELVERYAEQVARQIISEAVAGLAPKKKPRKPRRPRGFASRAPAKLREQVGNRSRAHKGARSRLAKLGNGNAGKAALVGPDTSA